MLLAEPATSFLEERTRDKASPFSLQPGALAALLHHCSVGRHEGVRPRDTHRVGVHLPPVLALIVRPQGWGLAAAPSLTHLVTRQGPRQEFPSSTPHFSKAPGSLPWTVYTPWPSAKKFQIYAYLVSARAGA